MKGEAAFFLIGLYFLLTAPYTKVEESSSVQAVHDLLFNPSVYDHQLFPGAVPRTAISALLTAIPLYPLLPFIGKSTADKTSMIYIHCMHYRQTFPTLRFPSNPPRHIHSFHLCLAYRYFPLLFQQTDIIAIFNAELLVYLIYPISSS